MGLLSWLRRKTLDPQLVAGQQMLLDAHIEFYYPQEAIGYCEFCKGNLLKACPQEVIESPMGLRVARNRKDGELHVHPEVCPYCRYADVGHGTDKGGIKRMPLAEFCEKYKWDGAVYPKPAPEHKGGYRDGCTCGATPGSPTLDHATDCPAFGGGARDNQ